MAAACQHGCTLARLLLRKWLKRPGARLAFFVSPDRISLLWRTVYYDFFCCNRRLPGPREMEKKKSIQKEATVPKAKKTHQAQDRWLMGNLQHPKPSSLSSVAMRSSGCSTVLKGLAKAELHPMPGLCFIYLILPFKCLGF